MEIGNKIMELRKKMGLSQEELASNLYITRQCLSKWEVGQSLPNIEMIISLTKILNVSIDELLCLDEELIVDE